MKKKSNRFINIETVRHNKQKKVMEEIQEQGHCPFCIENYKKYHKNPILKEGVFWIVTDNQWPYDNTKHQILAIYKKHIEHIKDMEPKAGKELFTFFQKITKKRNIPGGCFVIRFGENSKGNYGNSVKHLHAHLIEPDLEALAKTKEKKWKMKFGQIN